MRHNHAGGRHSHSFSSLDIWTGEETSGLRLAGRRSLGRPKSGHELLEDDFEDWASEQHPCASAVPVHGKQNEGRVDV